MLYGLPACLVAGAVPVGGAARHGAGRVGRVVGRRRGDRRRAAASRPRRGRGSAGCSCSWWRSLVAGAARRRPGCDDGRAMAVHLLTGDDESILRAAVSDLVHELVGDGDRSLMVDEFDGDDVELRAIVDAAQTPPFLTERRVVVARDIGRFTRRRPGAARRPTSAIRWRAPSWCSSAAAAGCPRRSPTPSSGPAATSRSTDPPHAGAGPPGLDRRPRRRGRRAARRAGRSAGRRAARRGRRTPRRPAGHAGGDVRRRPPLRPSTTSSRSSARRGGVPPWELTDAIDAGDTATALGAARPHERGRRAPPAAAHGDPPRPLRPAGPPRRRRGRLARPRPPRCSGSSRASRPGRR